MQQIVSNLMVAMLLSLRIVVADMRGYTSLCDSAFCRIVDDASKEVSSLRVGVDEGNCLSNFGQKADQICNSVSLSLICKRTIHF
jgi:hypothetical protein